MRWNTSSSTRPSSGNPSTPTLPQTFYEEFGTFDLASSAIRFTPNASGGWDVAPCASCFHTGYANGLGLSDDQLSRNHALGFSFPLAGGGTTTAIDIDSNGWVGLIANQHSGSDYTETVSEFLTDPARIAPCWDDLNPSSGGDVYFDTAAGVAYVTWDGVPEFSNTGSNTFQLQLFPSGEFVLAYQAMSIADCLVGYSAGGGVADPGGSDISNPSSITTLTLANVGLPSFGSTVGLVTTNYPLSTVIGAQVLSLTQHNPGIDLTSQGMPGCFQYVGLDASALLVPTGGTTTFNLSIPNATGLMGLGISCQSAAFVPGANPRGIITSNGVHLQVGN